MQHVKDIMTPNPRTCELGHDLNCALQHMKTADCGAVPIVDKDNKVQSIITDRDIALCLLEKQKPPKEITVQDCVGDRVGRVFTVRPEDDVHQAVKIMEQHQVRRLPVCDENMRLVGIIAQKDIALKDEDKREVAEMVEEISK